MGIVRLTLFTLVLLWLGMKYFGRDAGLSDHLIGREAEPAPVTVVMEEPAAPDAETALAPLGDSAMVTEPSSAVSATDTTPDATPALDGFDAQMNAALNDEINAAVVASELDAADESATPDSATLPADNPPGTPVAAEGGDTAVAPAQDDIVLPAEDDPSFMPTPEPDPALPGLLYVTGTKVNLRSDPSTTNEPIAALTLGTEVIDLGDVGDNWRQIQLQSGEIGFMSNDFLSPIAP